ncbi:MAG: thiamine-phosphate kinase [Betaproteobacteria bacterium]
MNEFELIARYFSRPPRDTGFVAQAGGDDCALLNLGDRQLAVTTDLLVEGRHFLPEVDPAALGHKALAVNLSDLAAAGATPRCFFLALALPRLEPEWLDAFSAGLYALADAHDCVLAGGDTTRAAPVAQGEGPRTFCITAVGEVPAGQAHGRGGARPGDELWVSGSLGDAALALAHLLGEVALTPAALAQVRPRLERPQPRVALGEALRGLATACIDVSDGLAGDAAHIAARSGVQLDIDTAAVPLGTVLGAQPERLRLRCALAGGDDYELLFTAPPQRQAQVRAAAQAAGVAVSRIGRVRAGQGVRLLDAAGQPLVAQWRGYDHFAAGPSTAASGS